MARKGTRVPMTLRADARDLERVARLAATVPGTEKASLMRAALRAGLDVLEAELQRSPPRPNAA